MTCWAVIPIKAGSNGKSRLADVLDDGARQELVRSMLARVVEAATEARMIDRVLLVGASRHGLPKDIGLLNDPGTGLNGAVQSAFGEVAQHKVDRILIVAADLPGVTSQELDLLALAPDDAIAIAPDRHETGTNAISLPLPSAEGFTFAFGTDSFALHQQEAHRVGLRVETILSEGLERDVDEPADLPDALKR